MADPEPGRQRPSALPPGPPEVPARPNNLVAEIVDQITEKQDRAARCTEAAVETLPICSLCLGETESAGPYQAVSRCATEEPESA